MGRHDRVDRLAALEAILVALPDPHAPAEMIDLTAVPTLTRDAEALRVAADDLSLIRRYAEGANVDASEAAVRWHAMLAWTDSTAEEWRARFGHVIQGCSYLAEDASW